MSGFLIVLLVGGVIGTLWLLGDSRAGVDTEQTTKAPQDVIANAVANIPVRTASMRSSWMPVGHTDRSATFVYKRRPSIIVALIGLVFFLVPGILYVVFAGKNQTLQIDCLPGEGGTTTVQASSSGGYARRRARAFMRSLGAGAEVAAAPASAG